MQQCCYCFQKVVVLKTYNGVYNILFFEPRVGFGGLSVIRFQSFEQYTSIMKNVLCFYTYKQGWGMGSITCKNNELLLLLPVNCICYTTITITHPVIHNKITPGITARK